MNEKLSRVLRGVPLSRVGGACVVFDERTDFRHDWDAWGVCRKCGAVKKDG
jgi:hypothetical protein